MFFLEINRKCFSARLLSRPSPQTETLADFEAERLFSCNQRSSTGKVNVNKEFPLQRIQAKIFRQMNNSTTSTVVKPD